MISRYFGKIKGQENRQVTLFMGNKSSDTGLSCKVTFCIATKTLKPRLMKTILTPFMN